MKFSRVRSSYHACGLPSARKLSRRLGTPPRSPQNPPSNDQTLRAKTCNQSNAIQALNHRTIGAKVRLLKKWGKCGRNDSYKGFSVPRNKHKNATESLPNRM